MTTETVTQVLDSTLDTVDCVENMALEVARRAGFRGDRLTEICFAVHETTVNAVIHGNRYSPQKKVLVAITVSEAGLKITIDDEGDGFDAEALPDPLAAQELLQDHGRGVFLSRIFMDQYHVRRRATGGTEVTLIKYFQPRESIVRRCLSGT
jgi:serine/threonine-protein kinase RsbW